MWLRGLLPGEVEKWDCDRRDAFTCKCYSNTILFNWLTFTLEHKQILAISLKS